MNVLYLEREEVEISRKFTARHDMCILSRKGQRAGNGKEFVDFGLVLSFSINVIGASGTSAGSD